MSIPAYVELTQSPHERLSVALNERTYSRIAILVDENTKSFCLPLLENLPEHELIEISPGEQHKTLETCGLIWSKLTEAGFDRKSVLINVGGGVIGDMGGFAAACYKRGINFINIPTTLLSQVDASIGGKLGVDFHGLKNQIGVFQMPLKVIISPLFLKTLEPRQINSGFAEVIKHGLISDAEYFRSLKKPENYRNDQFLDLITRSIFIKNKVVEEDPREIGLRKILNFGHTIGHAIESIYLDLKENLLHGEAIAAGMICEAYLSTKMLKMREDHLEEIVAFISNIYKKIDVEGVDRSLFIDKIRQDKKNKDKEIQVALLSEIGSAKYEITVSESVAIESLDYYSSIVQ